MRQMQGKSEIYKFKCCITILQTTVIFFFVEKKGRHFFSFTSCQGRKGTQSKKNCRNGGWFLLLLQETHSVTLK